MAVQKTSNMQLSVFFRRFYPFWSLRVFVFVAQWRWFVIALEQVGLNHRNIRPRMRAPILFQVNKWRLINYSKWPIYKGKLNSSHDILYTTLLGKIQDGGFIRAFLFSFWTPVTWQSTHSRSNISMVLTHSFSNCVMNTRGKLKFLRLFLEMYVADEIITAASGVRIRVNNTDAEGRFAMGDCLYYMKEEVWISWFESSQNHHRT